MAQLALTDIDRAQVTILVDNYTDLLLADTGRVKRMRVVPPAAPMSEHGLAYLVTVQAGDVSHTILMDAGISGNCLSHNAALLPLSLAVQFGVVKHTIQDVESIVLSHGHFDHFSGLPHFLKQTGKKMPLVVHPDAFVERRIKLGPELYVPMPQLKEEDLTAAGALVDKRAAASTVAGGLIAVAGSVERTTDFETGSPGLEAKRDGQWGADSFVDDQAIAFCVKDQGLVVLGGCSHAGIINTVKHLAKVTGTEKIHGVLGGFHLSGPGEALIEPTVKAMQAIGPDLIVPTHCTGWKAIHAFEKAMPEQFVLNTVGTTYLFGK
ncbi:MAG: MBL fold metallo-hydrolase [Desulfobacterales bacterium]|nr:MBL fold metallo-hydrolase [Desulfobacterales bacterium]